MRTETSRWVRTTDPERTSASLMTRFSEEFHQPATGVWFAPGRANLNGEHIDFHGGRCLPMALSHGTYVAAAPRSDGLLRLRTLDPDLDEGVVELPTTVCGPCSNPYETPATWTAYVSGVLWALQQKYDADEEPLRQGMPEELRLPLGFGADLLICSTLPIGAGLSSSASLECAAAMAFLALGTPVGKQNPAAALDSALNDDARAAIAQACIRAEVEVVGAGTGGLDQTTSMRGAKGTLLSLDCRDFSLSRFDVSALLSEHQLLAVDTGHTHRLADSDFGSRRSEAEAAARLLGADRLRDLLPASSAEAVADTQVVTRTLELFDSLTQGQTTIYGHRPSACRLRLEHALTEMLRSERIHQLLCDDNIDADQLAARIGAEMTEGHRSMRDYAQVSFPLANAVVETALENGGHGARLIGGGFGGSVLVLAPQEKVETIAAELETLSPQIQFLSVDPSAAATHRL